MRVEKIDLTKLHFESNRAYGGEGDIKILAEDIKTNGLINQLTVKPSVKHGEGHYDVVAGRRRKQALELIGAKTAPCNILENDEIDRAEEIAGSENINRLAMHPLDEATVFKKLLEEGKAIEELAKRYDRTNSAIWQRVQLLDLNDNIKTLFRNGNLSLHAAAMLKNLDEKGQDEFYKKYKDCYSVKHNEEIHIREITTFLSSRQHNKLYKFIVTNECKTCKKRTFYSDKGLFPELDKADDACLDRDCYLKRWNDLLSAKIRNCKSGNKTHADTVILAIDGKLKKFLGKGPIFNGTTYELKTVSQYGNDCSKKAEKGRVPCIRIELTYRNELEVSAQYWKDPSKSAASSPQSYIRESQFAPAVRLLELPKEEEKAAIKAFEDNSNKLSPYQLDWKLQEKLYWLLLTERSKKAPSDADIEWYLKEQVFDEIARSQHKKKIYKLFMGNDYSENQMATLKKIPKEKLFQLMSALCFEENNIPDPSDLENKRNTGMLKWLGMNADNLRKFYKEEISALMPKAKAVKKPEETKPAQPKKTVEERKAKKPTAVKRVTSKKVKKVSLKKAKPPIF